MLGARLTFWSHPTQVQTNTQVSKSTDYWLLLSEVIRPWKHVTSQSKVAYRYLAQPR